MPVLLARRDDARSGEDDLRQGQGPHRLEEQAAPLPPERQAGGRSGAGRLRAGGQRRVLEVPRHRVQEPVGAQHRELREVGQGGGRQDEAKFKARPRRAHLGRQGRQGPRRGQDGRRQRHAALPASTASRSRARSRSTSSRKSSTRSSRKAKAAIASGTKADKVYVEMSKENKASAPRKPKARRRRSREGRRQDRVEGARRRFAGARHGRRARHHRRVLRLPVPVLQARRRHDEEGQRDVRRQGPLRLEARAASVPPARRAGRGARHRGARKEKGDKGFWAAHDKLFDLQPKLEDADLEGVAKDLGLDVDKVKKAIKHAQVQGRSSTPTSTSPTTSRPAARRTSSSTVAASSARSRSRSSRRSSTRRSRRRKRSSPRAIAAARTSTTRS